MSGTTIIDPFGKLTVRKLVGELVALWPSWSGPVTSTTDQDPDAVLDHSGRHCHRSPSSLGLPAPDFTRLPLRTWSIGTVRQNKGGYLFVPARDVERQRVLALLPAQGGQCLWIDLCGLSPTERERKLKGP
jgi:hypothetical protein